MGYLGLVLEYVRMLGAGGQSQSLAQIGSAIQSVPEFAFALWGGTVVVGAGGGLLAGMGAGGLASGAVTIWGQSTSAIGGNGIAGELQLLRLGGQAQRFLPTPLGARFVDRLVNGVAHEAKVGFTRWSSRIAAQIAKDEYLLQSRTVKDVIWHFYTSPTTGLVGADARVLAALAKAGITAIVP